jgi:hypothetical protein
MSTKRVMREIWFRSPTYAGVPALVSVSQVDEKDSFPTYSKYLSVLVAKSNLLRKNVVLLEPLIWYIKNNKQ